MSGRGRGRAGVGHPTMQDVAERAGVSRALVSLALRGSTRVSEASRARVLKAANELGYRPNANARALASRQRHSIAVVLNDLHNPFFAEVIDGAQDVADAAGYRFLFGAGGGGDNREDSAVDALLEYRPDGIMLVAPRLPSGHIVELSRQAPLVVVSRVVRAPTIDCIMTDEAFGTRLAVEHLAELGHRRIAHAAAWGAGGPQRRRGFERAMAARSLADEAVLVRGGFAEAGGVKAAQELLASPRMPTGVIAANDLAAAGILGTLADAGVRVPEDVSLVGYDNTFLAGLHHIALTTVNQPRQEMGRLAMRALLERIGGRSEPLVRFTTPSLVVRRTTAPPP